MDKLKIFILIIAAAFSFFAYAQDKGEVREYNIGIIPSDKVFEKTYEIKEEISNAVSLCDCTEVSVIKKKDSSLIDIKFDPSEYKGLTIQEIKLLGKQNRVITLKLRAYVQSKPLVKPEGVKNNKLQTDQTDTQ